MKNIFFFSLLFLFICLLCSCEYIDYSQKASEYYADVFRKQKADFTEITFDGTIIKHILHADYDNQLRYQLHILMTSIPPPHRRFYGLFSVFIDSTNVLLCVPKDVYHAIDDGDTITKDGVFLIIGTQKHQFLSNNPSKWLANE